MKIQTPVIAGNWKLNKGPRATREFFAQLLPELEKAAAGSVLVFPPAISLAAARESIGEAEEVQLGVQNVYWEASGAFTGELSAPLAAEAGATVALVGHSERRHVFGESDAETVKKVKAVLAAGLAVILCVGETLDEREAGQAASVVERQLEAVLDATSQDDLQRFLVAYEPVWAIGTGRTASPEDASQMHREVRSLLEKRFGGEAAATIPILYGGSVKPDNAAELLSGPEIDGLLIGGASLDPASFRQICALRA